MNMHAQMTPSQILFSERAKAARMRMEAAALKPAKPPMPVLEQKPFIVAGHINVDVAGCQWRVSPEMSVTIGDDVIAQRQGKPRWRSLVAKVAEKHNLPVTVMLSKSRSRAIILARHETFWTLRRQTTMSLPDIARRMGGYDHTTVLHGIRKHEQRMKEAANG